MTTIPRLDELLFDACARGGEAIALEDVQTKLRFVDLATAARSIAEGLRAKDIQPNEPVLVRVANSPRDIAGFLGVWAAGGVAVPVSRDMPAIAMEATRAAVSARLMVGNGEAKCLAGFPAPPVRPLLAGAALIIFTSGSTGVAKGVVLGHSAFAGKLRAIDGVLKFSSATRALLVLQLNFVFGIWFSLLTLIKGGSVFMRTRFEPVSAMSDIAQRQITDAAFVPTMLRKIVATDPALLSRSLNKAKLQRIHTGGEPFSPALGRRIRELMPDAWVVDIYGLTETASSDFFRITSDREPFAGGIGRCADSEQFRIADAMGGEMSGGDVGELQIRTPFIMHGYLDQPELTRDAFVGDYFRTGDLARLRPDGTVELVGRSKDLILRGGAKISPLELDAMIAQHPAVAAALTVGVADAVTGERIHVMVVPRAHSTIGEDELRQWVASRVDRYKRPDVYHFAAELPTGRTGKVDRDALRRRLDANRQNG